MPFNAETMRIISVDDHLFEPPTLWKDRLPAKYQEMAPYVVTDGNQDVWVFEGKRIPYAPSFTVVAKRPQEEWGPQPVLMSEIIPSCYDPRERVKTMDEDGVWGSLCFPSFCRFAGAAFLECTDKGFGLACVQAYNDWMLEEWCAVAPDRFIPLGIVPLWDVDLAVKEVERIAPLGIRSISFPEALETIGLPSFHSGKWDPFFAAVSEAGMPLSCHLGTSQMGPPVSSDALGIAKTGTSAACIGLNAFMLMAFAGDLLLSELFTKFPKLHFALSEGGIGWIPYLKERLDYTWERQRLWSGLGDVRPSELFDRHLWGCFIDDEVGVETRYRVGVDNMMVEVDFPHSDSPWPHTQKRVTEMLRDVPDDEAHKIAELNARALYNFPA